MTPSLWSAAALGVLGVPAMLLFGVAFGVGITMMRTPRLDAWADRRGCGEAYGAVRALGSVLILVAVISGAAAVAIPAALAWAIWHDVPHTVVSGSVGAGLPVVFYALRTLSDGLHR